MPVAIITNARKQGDFVFLGLDDAKNGFTNELVQCLKAAMNDLIIKVKAAGGNGKDVFICQIDYTQDILGFFMSTNVMGDRKIPGDVQTFSELLGMDYSRSLSQLATCFQFTSMTLDGEE